MTYQSPRIYIYKITFEEVLYYYYGVHKENVFNEEYYGSPKTNKWCWDFYTPRKQILEVFPYTDEGWIKANEVEKRLIKPFFNSDKWCLNENVGGTMSLNIRRKNGKKSGKKSYELGIGLYSLTKEQKSEIGKKSGKKCHELGIGIHGYTKDQRIENSKKGGAISGKITKELGIGIHALTREQRVENGKKYGKISGKIGSKKTNSQKWQCTITGYICTSGPLTKYQRARGIDTSNRIRIE